MIYWIALFMWIISILTIIIFLKYNFDDKYLLIVSQIYNFMTGFLGFEIYFLLIMLSIKYLGNITNIYVCYLLPVIPIILLLFPLNIKVMKKVKTSIIVYLILSIFIIIFGFCIFVFLSNKFVAMI
ncbi:MAG: hypothetical protein BHW00_05025 [Clostridium sp. 26_22]|nr:MAG: hypothetical protein BHW00_05025 [Clostridium sp. 26_22]